VLRSATDRERTVALSSTLLPARGVRDEDAVLVFLADVTDQRRYHDELAYLADHDPLTGLANRRKFERALEAHLRHCRRYGSRGAVLLLDLDHFKEVNDTLGHATGDELLIDLGIVLLQRIRSTDLLARLGGDEFAVLLTEADRAGTEKVAGDIIAAVAAEMQRAADIRRLVTVSIGAVVIDAEDSRNVLSTVDMMLYEAKDAGRNRFAVLDLRGESAPPAGSRVLWTDRIERALAEDRFELHLQPIYDIRAGEVRGAEALLRMREGDDLVPPGEFLAVAERSSLIVEIDRWVIRRGVRLLADLQRTDPGFTVHLNISGRTVGNERIVAELRGALRAAAADPAGLVLEVTETAAITHMREARELVEQITALGCRLALDDFGAGFGSLYYLRHLPFDLVKIDGELVEGATASTVDRTLISAIVTMAAGLGQHTVAEYVSSHDRLRTVAGLGVDHAQGAFLGMPVPVHDFVAMLADPPPRWRGRPDPSETETDRSGKT
jgi:diguanylate cyclase (GGDEF)-like protein